LAKETISLCTKQVYFINTTLYSYNIYLYAYGVLKNM